MNRKFVHVYSQFPRHSSHIFYKELLNEPIGYSGH